MEEEGGIREASEAAWYAAESNDLPALRACEDVVSSLESQYGRTPLHSAAERGHMEALHFLVDARANLDAVDNGGDTPLHRAALESKLDAVRALLRAGADVTRANRWNHVALWYALSFLRNECAAALLCGGARVEHLSDDITVPPWVQEFQGALDGRRAACRAACIALLGVRRFRASRSALPPYFGRDVVTLIGKQVWLLRESSEWGHPLPDVPETPINRR